MTVTTIDTIIADVMFMTELYGLLAFDPLAGVPGGTIKLNGGPKRDGCDKDRTIDRYFRERISAVVKYLWHRRRI